MGSDRESVWRAVQRGQSGVRVLRRLRGIPDGMMLGATVELEPEQPGQLKVVALALRAAAEAMADSRIGWSGVDYTRFGCAVAGHMGDTAGLEEKCGLPPRSNDAVPWYHQWLPNSACHYVGRRFGLLGPRLCHSTACASGLIEVLAGMRAIQDGRCDAVLAGSAEAIHPLFAAGFHAMRVLAWHEDPAQACRPFDSRRNGFVMGEGAAMFVLERLDHALQRGARIYAEILAGKMLAEAHHVTDLDLESEALRRLIIGVLQRAHLPPEGLDYINAHGTGTQQNDPMEVRGIRRALGAAADRICVSSTKSMLGHLVNAAGSVELAITVLALRDGYVPPTANLTDPDPRCDLDCIPLVGREVRCQHALKLSVAFGGHLAAVVLRRWNDASTGFAYPVQRAA
ncbi:MAG: beta-ketoacyl-[acyl-carrier-protein] synthase family protein [Pirellulales bacterium]|nr:beta-ketoacyl-[acyl-carrier-protein] synthase family protein [Pirellulales bacterium]